MDHVVFHKFGNIGLEEKGNKNRNMKNRIKNKGYCLEDILKE